MKRGRSARPPLGRDDDAESTPICMLAVLQADRNIVIPVVLSSSAN